MSLPAVPASLPRSGLFIAIEGGEGAGKSTQIAALHRWLTDTGLSVVLTREPGGSRIGPDVRRILLDPDTGDIDSRTEALLFAAERAEHVAGVVRPALDAGQVVITDRYMDSSAAYQGAGRGLGLSDVIGLSMWATGGLVPDLTIVLDIDPRAGLARATTTEFGAADRFESEKIEFADAVRSAFLDLAAAHPQRYLVLDATQAPEVLATQVQAALLDRFADLFAA